jgi:hypothetical protein
MTDTAIIDRLAQGRARMKQIGAENKRDRLELESRLVASLGRVPSAAEAIAIETLAASMVRVRRLQDLGKPDLEERRLVVRLLKELGLKDAPQKPTDPSAGTVEWLNTFKKPSTVDGAA